MSLHDQKYAERIQRALSKYPDKRSAVMPLLYMSQEDYGYITDQGVVEVAQLCDMDPTQVRSIAGFYTMYRERPKGKYWLQVCTDLPCALRGADKFYADLLAYLGLEAHQPLDAENASHEGSAHLAGKDLPQDSHHNANDTTADGLFTVEHVMCLAACDKAPMLQCNFHFHENLDMDKMKTLIEQWRAEAKKA
jgi:NADH:ubiquinone oxidoreductase subunit E